MSDAGTNYGRAQILSASKQILDRSFGQVFQFSGELGSTQSSRVRNVEKRGIVMGSTQPQGSYDDGTSRNLVFISGNVAPTYDPAGSTFEFVNLATSSVAYYFLSSIPDASTYTNIPLADLSLEENDILFTTFYQSISGVQGSLAVKYYNDASGTIFRGLSPIENAGTAGRRTKLSDQVVLPHLVGSNKNETIYYKQDSTKTVFVSAYPLFAIRGITTIDLGSHAKVLEIGSAATTTAISMSQDVSGSSLDLQEGDIVLCAAYAKHAASLSHETVHFFGDSGEGIYRGAIRRLSNHSLDPPAKMTSQYMIPFRMGSDLDASAYYRWTTTGGTFVVWPIMALRSGYTYIELSGSEFTSNWGENATTNTVIDLTTFNNPRPGAGTGSNLQAGDILFLHCIASVGVEATSATQVKIWNDSGSTELRGFMANEQINSNIRADSYTLMTAIEVKEDLSGSLFYEWTLTPGTVAGIRVYGLFALRAP